jgi:hypothetical protein
MLTEVPSLPALASWSEREASGIGQYEVRVTRRGLDDLVEDIRGVRIVHGNFNIAEELLVLLRSHYPDDVPVANILKSLERRSEGSVRNKLRDLMDQKLAFGDAKAGYRLTKVGYQKALDVITRATETKCAS